MIELLWPSGVRQIIQARQVNATVTIDEPITRQQ
jgi:hypothetical protein